MTINLTGKQDTHCSSHTNSEEKMFSTLYNHNEADEDWDDILKKDCPLFLLQSTCINPQIHKEQYKYVSDGFMFTKTLLSMNHLHLKTVSTINVRTWPTCRTGLIHEQKKMASLATPPLGLKARKIERNQVAD